MRRRHSCPMNAASILKAALEVGDTDTPDKAAKRWVPWLCAYTGARPGEISQLRGSDVIERDDIPAIRITPGAGAVKGGKARVVPLHEHLIAQGFLEFVRRRGTGPLFYNPPRQRSDDGTRMKKPRAVQARQRLANWVRSLGITDAELSPLTTHGGTRSSKSQTGPVFLSARLTTSQVTPPRASAQPTEPRRWTTWRRR